MTRHGTSRLGTRKLLEVNIVDTIDCYSFWQPLPQREIRSTFIAEEQSRSFSEGGASYAEANFPRVQCRAMRRTANEQGMQGWKLSGKTPEGLSRSRMLEIAQSFSRERKQSTGAVCWHSPHRLEPMAQRIAAARRTMKQKQCR